MWEQCWSGKNTWSTKQEYTLCILLACMIFIHHFINFAIWTAKTKKKFSHAALAGQDSVSASKPALLSADAKKSFKLDRAAGMRATQLKQCTGLATQAASPLVLSATFNSMGIKVIYIYIILRERSGQLMQTPYGATCIFFQSSAVALNVSVTWRHWKTMVSFDSMACRWNHIIKGVWTCWSYSSLLRFAMPCVPKSMASERSGAASATAPKTVSNEALMPLFLKAEYCLLDGSWQIDSHKLYHVLSCLWHGPKHFS